MYISPYGGYWPRQWNWRQMYSFPPRPDISPGEIIWRSCKTKLWPLVWSALCHSSEQHANCWRSSSESGQLSAVVSCPVVGGNNFIFRLEKWKWPLRSSWEEVKYRGKKIICSENLAELWSCRLCLALFVNSKYFLSFLSIVNNKRMVNTSYLAI